MKTRLIRKTKQLASALLTTLVICSILAIFVLYYMSLIDQQSYLNCRSQTWNMAIAITEGGIEEGLQQLNQNFPDMNTDGWTYDGSTMFWKSNTLPGGNSYMTCIYITNALFPVVLSRASVTMPPKYVQNASSAFLAAVGTQFSSPGTNVAPVNRAVAVTCTRRNPFQYAMVAKMNIDLNGKNVVTDSFNSQDPTKSTNGQYDPAKAGSRGDIATNLGVVDSINGGNASVYGHAHTGPGSQSTALQVGSLGYVGNSADRATVGSGNVDPGYWLPDSNFSFPTTTYPNTTGYQPPPSGYLMTSSNWTVAYTTNSPTYPNPAPAGGVSNICGLVINSFVPPLIPCCSIVTNNNNGVKQFQYTPITGYSYTYSVTGTAYYTNQYDNILYGNGGTLANIDTTKLNSASNPYVLTSGVTGQTNYFVSSSLSGNTFVAGSNVVVAIANGLNMSGNDTLTVGQNANVIAYSGGTSCTVSGNGVVNNAGYAADFVLYCAPTVTSLSFNGNGAFMGCIVAPNANVAMNGGGNSGSFTGCLIANSVQMTGNTKFHYDEALAGNNIIGRFLVLSWNEVK